jgi:hypothetical protein
MCPGTLQGCDVLSEKEYVMAIEQAWQLVKAYQDAVMVGTPQYGFTPYEQAGALIVRLGVLQAYSEAEQRAEEASFAGDQASASFWTIVYHVLSMCLDGHEESEGVVSCSDSLWR